MIIAITAQLEVHDPEWARNPAKPEIAGVHAGILYSGIDVDAVLELLRCDGTEVLEVHAAIGRAIFWARDDGQWLPYNRELPDMNEDCRVREREFPWNWGDDVWVSAIWQGMPAAARMSRIEDGAFICAPGTGRVMPVDMIGSTRLWAHGVAGEYSAQVDAARFRADLIAGRLRQRRA